MQYVLGLIVLYVGLAHSWDIAVTHGDVLEFYTNETKINTVRFDSRNFGALTYDEVHNMLLYVDKQKDNDAICGYDISSIENKCFIERNGRNIRGLAFDPATELLFFSDTNERSINWISLKSGSKNNISGNLLLKMDHGIPTDIAVDSCRGFVYWINTNLTTPTIERVQFNGSDREYVINLESMSVNTTYKLEPHSLAIDQQTKKMYWIEYVSSSYYGIYYTDLNGRNKTLLNYLTYDKVEFPNPSSNTLTILKTSLFWVDWHFDRDIKVYKLGKLQWAKFESIELHLKNVTVGIVANYKIKDRIQDINDCEALTSLERNNYNVPSCVHGLIVTGQSICKCTPGLTGERCDFTVCDNYCIQGNCSVDDEGLPKCRCNAGYSGDRCEVDACHGFCLNNGDCALNEKSEPVCQCKGDHTGVRCEVLECLNYYIQGNCSYNNGGFPECRCNAGYFGERCEINGCYGYCLNDGVCSLNEEDEASCECVGSYEGSRCEAVQNVTLTFPSSSTYSVGTNQTLTDLLTNMRNPKILVIVDDS